MAYFGNTPAERFSAVTKDTFSGTGSATEFTLTNPGTTNGVEVFVENVRQEPTTAYSVSGTTLTFTAAPASGTNNIYVVNSGTPVSTITHPPGTALEATSGTFSAGVSATSGTFSGVVGTSTTGGLKIPAGTDAQRPGSPSSGMTRWNTTSSVYEFYNGTSWQAVTRGLYNIDALIVAGGGGGGGLIDGGGGAGGLLSQTGSSKALIEPGVSYTVTVGAGGTGASAYNGVGTAGEDSVFGSYTAIGGGGGGTNTLTSAMNGGSGGGRGHGATGAGGSGTSGQGNDGGGHVYVSPNYPSGGGGGAGAAGTTPASGSSGGGAGGVGSISTIISSTIATAQSVGEVSGSDVYYAGGGGGGVYAGGSYGAGGSGGGSAANAGSATANTGGGGGADDATNNGGSGVVILRMATSNYSGTYTGTDVAVVTDGSDTILIFRDSGTYTG